MAKIGLDFGHGSDTFPPSKGVYKDGKAYHEHNFNALLGGKVKDLLEAKGHTVILGQQPYNPEVPLSKRIALYNRENVDIVWSIHANAGNKTADGRCAFYWHTSSKSKKLATLYVEEVKKAGYSTHGNGLHASMRGSWTNLAICRDTKMPAVLTENGFMTNDDDFELVFGSKQENYTDKMAQVHVRAIQRYLGGSTKIETPKPKPVSKSKAQLRVDGKWGNDTTRALQIALDTVVDGKISDQLRNQATMALYGNTVKFGNGRKGSLVIKALQRKIGAKVDGLLGAETVRKLQIYLGSTSDGVLSRPSLVIEKLQEQLNRGEF